MESPVITDRRTQGEPSTDFWERITGSDLNRDWQTFEDRAAVLPEDYRPVWGQIKTHLILRGGLTGRKAIPTIDGVLELLETTAAEGRSVREALGDDVPAFCAAPTGGDLLSEIVDLFEVGVASGKGVMELIGPDVAAFCDGLIGDPST